MNTSLRASKTIYKSWVSQLTALGTPQLNGAVERMNKTLLEIVRALMSIATLHVSLWGYGLERVAYLLNIVPFKSVSKIPTELWLGHKFSLSHIHIWGCQAHEELPC
jgi:hypothetical protein